MNPNVHLDREAVAALAGRDVDMAIKEALRNPYHRKEILANREIIHAA